MSNTLTISIKFPKGFFDELTKEIDDELAIAQKKWKYTLAKEEIAEVKKASQEQLRLKVSGLAKSEWTFGGKLIINATGASDFLEITPRFKEERAYGIVLNKNGWLATSEESDSVVQLKDFYQSLVTTLTTWLRTAVFYGVGSYVTLR